MNLENTYNTLWITIQNSRPDPKYNRFMLGLIGINHKTAPVEIREKFAISEKHLEEILFGIKTENILNECVILSTCNRVEFYYVCDKIQEPIEHIEKKFLTTNFGDVKNYLYTLMEDKVIQHLFNVASGLDSMVLGENEILAQVKKAYFISKDTGFTSKLTNILFQRALYVGKLVRTDTGISTGFTSAGSVAVVLAEKIFGNLAESKIMILGAGKISELTVKYLLKKEIKSLIVSNRTYEKAVDLAKKFSGKALHFEEGLQNLKDMDIIICSTSAPKYIIHKEQIQQIMKYRHNKSLFFIDLSVPRNIEPEVGNINNVYLYNIDDMDNIVNENLDRRKTEIDKAKNIVKNKTQEFVDWYKSYISGEIKSLKHKR